MKTFPGDLTKYRMSSIIENVERERPLPQKEKSL